MCLAVPMQVVDIAGARATVASGGMHLEVGVELVGTVRNGDWLIVHAGYAIEVLDAASAAETLALFAEVAAAQRADLDTGDFAQAKQGGDS